MKQLYLTKSNFTISDSPFHGWNLQLLLILLCLLLIGNQAAFAQKKETAPEKKFFIETFSPVIGCPGTIISIKPKAASGNSTTFTPSAKYMVTFVANEGNKILSSVAVEASYVNANLLKVKLPKMVSGGMEITNGKLLDITVTQTSNGIVESDLKNNAFTYQIDSAKPSIASVAGIPVDMDMGQCSAALSLVAPTATDNCSEVVVTSNIAELNLPVVDSKTMFPKGATTIIWTATDGSGNSVTTSQLVTVSDKQAPVFVGAQLKALDLTTDAGVCAATIVLTAPEASDNCSVTVKHNLHVEGGKVTFPKGTSTIVWTAADASGNMVTKEQIVNVRDNEVPKVIAPASITGVVASTGLCSAEVNLGSPEASDNCGVASIVAIRSDAKALTEPFSIGTTTITYTATDVNGNTAQATQTVTVADQEKPVISGMPADMVVPNEAGKCSAIVSWELPKATDNCSVASFTSNIIPGDVFMEGTHTVTYTAIDASGNQQHTSFTVTVTNKAPEVTLITAPVEAVLMGSAVTVNITFADDNLAGATLNWGDGTMSYFGSHNVNSSQDILTVGGQLIIGNHAYTTAGFYKLSVTLTDACGKELPMPAQYEHIMVYDPKGGFVTGGGWITSYKNDKYQYMKAEGKANFGFVAKYKESSIVEGHTNFQFSAGDMHFKSVSHDDMRLIISGNKVNYKGKGTINGAGSYGFLLSAIDGQFNGGTATDNVRMKIWDLTSGKVVYDNQNGAKEEASAATGIGGGSIVIHTSATHTTAMAETAEPALLEETTQIKAYPNPFEDRVMIDFGKVLTENVVVTVLNSKGAAVYQQTFTSSASQIELNLSGLEAGIFYVQSVHGTDSKMTKIIKF